MESKLSGARAVVQVRGIADAAVRLNQLIGDCATVSEYTGSRVLIGDHSVGRAFDFVAYLSLYLCDGDRANLARSQPDFELELW